MNVTNLRWPHIARRWVTRGAALLLCMLPVAMVGCLLSPTSTERAVSNNPPRVTVSAAPDSGAIPLTVSFSGTVSDPDGSVASYHWNFGDGTGSDQLAIQHTYTVDGDFEASLVAMDDRGMRDSSKVKIHARGNSNRRPSATITATPMTGLAPLAVSFTGSGTDPDGSIVSYAWAFGDGSTATDQNPSHTYTSPGTYTAKLTVTDNGGATGTAQVHIAVTTTTNQAPTATASATPTSGTTPLTVAFTGMGSDADGTIASYAWAFGDGGTSTQQNPSHTYTTGGNFTARLTVTDDLGATGSATVAIAVTAPTNLAPLANAGLDQLNKDPGTTITLSGAGSSDPDGSIASYAWTQVSGPAVTLTGANTATPSFRSPAASTASYTFMLTVTDNGSPAKTATDNVVVSTRVTYANTVGALLLARGTQSNGDPLGCTTSGCHSGTNSLPPLSTYLQVFNVRTAIKSKISTGGSMARYLQTGEAPVVISWIDAGAVEKN